jgi:hypothetical protein
MGTYQYDKGDISKAENIVANLKKMLLKHRKPLKVLMKIP